MLKAACKDRIADLVCQKPTPQHSFPRLSSTLRKFPYYIFQAMRISKLGSQNSVFKTEFSVACSSAQPSCLPADPGQHTNLTCRQSELLCSLVQQKDCRTVYTRGNTLVETGTAQMKTLQRMLLDHQRTNIQRKLPGCWQDRAASPSLLKELETDSSTVSILHQGVQGPQRGCRQPVPHSVYQWGCGICILEEEHPSSNNACSQVHAMRLPQLWVLMRLSKVLRLHQQPRGQVSVCQGLVFSKGYCSADDSHNASLQSCTLQSSIPPRLNVQFRSLLQ